jgi:large repetitive protein
VVLATFAGLVLILSACEQPTGLQPTNSPDTTPSTAAGGPTPTTAPTPSTAPPPVETPPPAATPSSRPARLIITSVTFHMGEVGLTYGTVTAGAAGGVKPYKWSISSGALPPGLAVSSGGGKTTGKPTAAGTFSFVIRVDDSAGGAAGVPRSIYVFRQIAFTTTSAKCSDTSGTGCTTTLQYTGGASNATPKIIVTLRAGDPPLPPGSTITAKAGVVTVSIADQCNAFSILATLVLVDPSPCSVNYKCSSAPASVAITKTFSC